MKNSVYLLLFLTLFLLKNFTFGQFPPKQSDLEIKTQEIFRKKGVEEVIKYLTGNIEKKENLFEAYKIRANYFALIKDYDRAITDLDALLLIKPNDAETYRIRSVYKKIKNDLKGALLDLELAEKNGYDKIEISFSKARIKEKLNDVDGAIAEYQYILNSFPDSIDSAMELNRLLFDFKKEQNKAITNLTSYLEEFVKRKNGRIPKVPSETVKNGYPKVENGIPIISHTISNVTANGYKDFENLTKISEEAKSFAVAYVLLGLMYIKINDFDTALQVLDKAIKVNKNQFNAFGLKGKIYIERKEYEKAIQSLNKAIDMADIATLYYDRGLTLLLLGKENQAQNDFKHFLRHCPECKTNLDSKIAEIKKLKSK